MDNIKVSVIMANYNCGLYLDEAIKSILNQTFIDFELIIIDDASTDNSLKIIEKYLKISKKIRLIKNKINSGPTISRNIGIKIAKGKYIAILDSDDVAINTRLEKQFNFLEKNTQIFLIGTGSINITQTGEKINVFKPLTYEKKIAKKLEKQNCIYHSTIMFKNQNRYYREKFFKYSEDYDFYLNLLSEGKKILNLKEPLIKYRINPNSISWKNSALLALFAEKAKEFYFQRITEKKDKYDEFQPEEILNINIENTTNKIILEAEINANFRLNNFKIVRILSMKYFKNKHFNLKILIYFILSFFSIKTINLIRKLR